jgi:hypothetical protein
MADSASLIGTWLRAVEAFNQGDLATFGEVIAEDCTFPGWGNNKDEIMKTLQQNRDQGWVSHHPIGVVTAGRFLAGVQEDHFADGSTVFGAGIGRFNEDGQITEFAGLVPIEGQPGSTDSAGHVGRWMRQVEAFNRGDLATFGEALTVDCTWEPVSGNKVASKAEILKALQQGRDDGWVSNNTIGCVAAGEFFATTFEIRFADGRSVIWAGLGRVNADGQFCEFVSRET